MLVVQRILYSIQSESDNATKGVIWKARDLWSAPVKRRGSANGLRSHHMCGWQSTGDTQTKRS